MEELFDLRQAAQALHLSVYTLRSWTYQRRIPFVRLGRRVLIRRGDIEAVVEKNVVEAKK